MALIEEAVLGEFISKVFNDVTDISKDKIREATNKRRNKHQSLESQIYNIVVDVLNKITYDKYEDNQDKIYDVAEKILKGFKSSEDNNSKSIKIGLSDICENVDENKCIDFMRSIYQKLSKENHIELYREIRLLQQEKEGNKTSRIEHKVDKIQYEVKEVNEKLDKIETNGYDSVSAQNKSVKKKSRTQEYADKWNANMFLNDFDEWDENAGINVKLSDVYLDDHLPHFIWGNNKRKDTKLKKLLTKYIEKNNRNDMLLILGQPGMGKSTLITWITANFNERVDDILVYQFASDLKNVVWEKDDISERILKELGYLDNDLNGKILILDGYDEISVKSDRKEILNELNRNLVKKLDDKNFSLIITCRENYIKNFERVECKYITLRPWDEKQIRSFCNIFQEKTNKNIFENTIEKLIDNREIFGIPLILYMVLALNISIEKEGSIVDVYDKIFSIEGGIYDRCIDFKRFADSHGVISKIKQQMHQITREIAMWMFENNPDEAYIPKEEYKKICSNIVLAFANKINEIEQQIHQILEEIGKRKSENSHSEVNNRLKECEEICAEIVLKIISKEKVREQDYIIGNFFKLKHYEGEEGEQIYFVHRSIYEYFFVEYLFCSMINVIDSSKEDLASVFGKFLKGNILSLNLLKYLKIKILNSKLYDNFDIVYQTFQIMLQDGMTYHASKNYKDSYENVMDCEMNVFCNMLEIIHLWDNCHVKFNDSTTKYIRYNYTLRLNLIGADLSGANLIGANLSKANLSGANLSGTNLFGANLGGTNLSGADLSRTNLFGANLSGTNLSGADLSGANLFGALLDEINIRNLDDTCNVLLAKIYISSTKEIISYEDYCKMPS